MQHIQLKVSNVKCGGCVSAIQEGLGEITGISSVRTDTPTVDVSLQAEQPNLTEIQDKRQSLGYLPVT